MNNTSVIIYRSRMEQTNDEFLSDIMFPWMYNHWGIILLTILTVAAVMVMLSKKR